MLQQFFIVCPLVFVAGFVDAIAGGGGLISLPAYLMSGVPAHFAIGTNKLSSGMGTALATYRYARSGYICWRVALWCALAALAGSSVGSSLALSVDDATFRIIILMALPLTAVYVLSHKKSLCGEGSLHCAYGWRTTLLCMGISLFIGAYDGFYGPGTGTFLLLLFTGVVHLGLHEANGLTKMVNLTTNIASLTVFLLNGKVLLLLGLVAGCFSLLGNYVGTRFFIAKGAAIARPLIICVLSLLFLKVLWGMIG